MTDNRLQALLSRMPHVAGALRNLDPQTLRQAKAELLAAFSDTKAAISPAHKGARAGAITPANTAASAVARSKVPEGVKPSPLEAIKSESDYLRGEIREELASDTDHFEKSSVQLLKFHGTYQQDNRDARVASAGGKSQKQYSMMIRLRVPGGRLTSDQFLSQLDLCDELGNSTLRLTTRQTLQTHGIPKRDLREAIRRINQAQMTTIASCGDVARNVMCCPAAYHSPLYETIQTLSLQLSQHLAPQTRAYHEIWLQDNANGDRELVGGGPNQEEETIYGRQYLPRKFKIAVGFPHDNCVDIYTHDLGLLAVVRDDRIVGYNVLVGGGMGVTPSAKKTFPALAKRMAFIEPDQVLDVATAIVRVQRDFGNRSDRKVARLKYLIHRWGLERFKEHVEEYFGAALAAPQPDDVHGFNDHIGWEAQGDDRWTYGLNIENGRIKDEGEMRLKSALREIGRIHQPGIRLTPHQSILFTDIADTDRDNIEVLLRDHGVTLSEEISPVRRWSMACVAWPTCPLAITESERALPGIMDAIEAELAKVGLSSERFTVRMTGCPNGCARPYNADIGLVGKAKGKYTIFLGGRLLGTRLNFLYRDLVPGDEIARVLAPVFFHFKESREPGETFGDFCHRQGRTALLALSEHPL